jgi:hypothetical protein
MSEKEVKNLELLFQARIDNDEKIEPKIIKSELEFNMVKHNILTHKNKSKSVINIYLLKN